MISIVVLLFLVGVVFSNECYDDGSEFCIDENDILSADLLPGSFLLVDQYYSNNNVSRSVDKTMTDGSFVKAYDEMEYHR